jgi:hypothetical protein
LISYNAAILNIFALEWPLDVTGGEEFKAI